MARLIIILALVAGFIMLYRSLFGGASPRRDNPTETTDMAQDPNCGTYVPKRQAVTKSIQGNEHFFCSKKCADEYSPKKK
jgi:YHS domain-containing protein